MDNTTKNADLQPDGTPFGRLRLRLEDGTTLSDEIVSFTLTAGCGADTTGPSLGSTAAATITVKLAGTDRKLENQFLLPEVRYTLGGREHWMPLGRFRCETPETGEDTVTVTAVDAMLWALEAGYFPEGAPSTAFAVLRDVAAQAGVALGSLDGLTDVPVSGVGSGYTLREMAGYMAALLGRNAVIGRDGQLALRWFSSSGVTVTPDDYYSGGFTRKDYDYTVSSIQVSVGDGEEDTLSSGSGTGLRLANPYMTETVLKQVWTAVGGLSYRPGEVTILGNLSLEPGDLVTVTGLSGSSCLFPVLEVTHSYDGGWKTKLSAYGSAETDTNSSYKGPTTAALERYTADMASFKQLYAQNLTATNAKFATLTADVASLGSLTADKLDASALTAYRAEVETLLADKADVSDLTALQAQVTQLDADKASITDLTATNATLTNVTADVADISSLLAGSAGVGNLQAIHLTGANAVIDDAIITDAMIANLSASKLTAGTIYTSLIKIASDENENLLIDGSTMQIKDAGGITRVQIGKDALGDYNLALWGADGALLWDASGVYAAGLHDGIIRDVAIADDANINQSKIDMASVAKRLNEDGSITVDASRVQIDNTTLAAAYKTVTTNVTAAQTSANNAQTSANTAQAAADEAQESIDNLQVGGRNLVKMVSGTSAGNVSVSDNTVTLTYAENKDTYFYIYVYHELSVGKQYVISFDCSGVLDGDRLIFGITKFTNAVMTLQNGRCSKVFTPVSDVAAGDRFIVDDAVRVLASGAHNIVLSNFKVEEGNTPTAYTPAPEDAETAITAVTERTTALETSLSVVQGQIAAKVWQSDITAVTDPLGTQLTTLEDNYSVLTLTVDGVQTRVGAVETTTDGLSSRMSVAESAITQQADQINLKVSKDGIISEINQTSEAVTINANRINLTDVFAQDITATGTITGATLVGGTIQGATLKAADSITAGSNFSVDGNGQLRARNAILEGSICLWDEINKKSLMVFRAAAGAECCSSLFFSNGIHVQNGAEFNDTLSVSGAATMSAISCTNLAASGSVSTYGYTIPRIQYGSVSATLTAGTPGTFTVTFPKAFGSTPVIVFTPIHNSNVTSISYKIMSRSAAGFTGYVISSGGGTYVFNWIAMY